jgi:hypothetical protein
MNMLASKAVASPTLDANGSFAVNMGEFAVISRDTINKPITNTATGGTNIIPMADTSGFFPGQSITIKDTLSSENGIVLAVTAGVQITTVVNLVSTYTVARGGQVTVRDQTRLITGTATGGGVVIPMADTSGFVAGQTIIIEDSANAEAVLINAIVANTQITATGNLVHTYTVARGARVSNVNGNPARASASMRQPYAATATGSRFIACDWYAGVNWIVIVVQQSTAAGGPLLPYTWAVATTAMVAGLNFTVEADGQ